MASRSGTPSKRELWAAHLLYASGQEDQAKLDRAVQEVGIKPPRQRKPRDPTIPSEHQEQVAFVKWFRLQYPGVLIFAIPNGGARDVVTGRMLKEEGVIPDVPDLFIPAWRLFIEMKRRDGERPKSQREMHDYLRGCGYVAEFAKGAEEAMRIAVETKIMLAGKPDVCMAEQAAWRE